MKAYNASKNNFVLLWVYRNNTEGHYLTEITYTESLTYSYQHITFKKEK